MPFSASTSFGFRWSWLINRSSSGFLLVGPLPPAYFVVVIDDRNTTIHNIPFTWDGPINVKNASFIEDETPLDPSSDCPASRDYTKAYLNHLFKAGEYLGPMLLSWHNLDFYQKLMAAMRAAIAEGRFAQFASDFRARHQEKS